MASSTMELCLRAKRAAASVATLRTEQKNEALLKMAEKLEEKEAAILAANAEDLAEAEKNGIGTVMADRLRLTSARIKGMADGLRALAELPDPVGKVDRTIMRPNGLLIQKVRVPLGVIAIIYESRPNVTSDAAGITFKSGNACVLRGGKESYRSSAAVVSALKEALSDCGITEDAVNLVSDLTHAGADELMTASGLVDLLIPRGGAGLIRRCVENAKVPCIQTGTGICHLFVDASAEEEQALAIVNNAKTQRPSVCNAAEVCLV
ncbi:MAG TPA: glutamate-5-semialdehyde dehydrogenase, partial [Clostridiales bacterium]|nr:glutamate-5-semialdehyde dehydrogenase [Clostridiales bacterium]